MLHLVARSAGMRRMPAINRTFSPFDLGIPDLRFRDKLIS